MISQIQLMQLERNLLNLSIYTMIEIVIPLLLYCVFFSPHHILVIVFPVKLTWPLCEVHCKFAYLLIPAIKGRTIIVASVFLFLDLNRKYLLFEDQPDEEESTIKPSILPPRIHQGKAL